jgi:site-specific recombinase XerD
VTRSRDPNEGLPPFAVEYLALQRSSRRVLRSFHVWLRRSGRPILRLAATEVDDVIAPILAAQRPSSRSLHRRRLFRYFDWLHARKLLSFDPRCLWPRSNFALPPEAARFTAALEPTHKRGTVSGYRTSLRQFHIWLHSQDLRLDAVERMHVSSWLDWLHKRGLSACYRVHAIQSVRAYFRWLEEQPDYAGCPTEHLFRSTDLPKLPQYLPRPVPADLDRILQRRLRKSHDPLDVALLLMRRTGVRIGELRALPYHCVHHDHAGRDFLKVPLGKLDNERLVPLDPATLRLIEKLRVLGSRGRRGKRRALLLETASGQRIAYDDYRRALVRICKGLVFVEPMTSHRLRHTYATSMLAGGVSLPALMKLLGHRDYRMTLRYAAITIETVAAEHAEALQKIERRYELAVPTERTISPTTTIADVARHLLSQVDDAGLDRRHARTLVRRLNRLSAAIQRLLRECARQATRPD